MWLVEDVGHEGWSWRQSDGQRQRRLLGELSLYHEYLRSYDMFSEDDRLSS